MALQGIVQDIHGPMVTLAADYATLTPLEGCMFDLLLDVFGASLAAYFVTFVLAILGE